MHYLQTYKNCNRTYKLKSSNAFLNNTLELMFLNLKAAIKKKIKNQLNKRQHKTK